MKATYVITLLAAALLAGCQHVSLGGLVTSGTTAPGWEKGLAMGLKAPQVKFTGADGKERLLHSAWDSITIIGFVESKGQECCLLSPVLAEAASRYWNKPVRVVQVSLPTEQCPHGAGCVESCHVRPLHLMALCDSSHTAHTAFGRPRDRTLLLLDSKGKVVRVTTVDRIEGVFPLVDEYVEEAERQAMPGYDKVY